VTDATSPANRDFEEEVIMESQKSQSGKPQERYDYGNISQKTAVARVKAPA
jgi:hypothetical protein